MNYPTFKNAKEEDEFMDKIGLELFYGYAFYPNDKENKEASEKLNNTYKSMFGDTWLNVMCKSQGFKTFDDVVEFGMFCRCLKINVDEIVNLALTGNKKVQKKISDGFKINK